MVKEMDELAAKGKAAKEAASRLACLPTETKNGALREIATGLIKSAPEILEANRLDYNEARTAGLGDAMLDRLMLDEERVKSIAADVAAIIALPDPVGEVFDMRTMPNGLLIGKKRVPMGVIAAIYESRPNVTIDIASLCLKSGNAVILRGGKETLRSNIALAKVVSKALGAAGVPPGAVQLIEGVDRGLVTELLKMRGVIDLVIPRGGAGLIKFVRDNAAMPVVAGGIGVCHTYVDKSADQKKAAAIVYNAKVQRPTVCNALDTILVHKDIAAEFLPKMAAELGRACVELHCDGRSLAILGKISGLKLVPASGEDWGKEFLALIAAVKVVDSLDGALEHIFTYGSGHSEAIITEDYTSAMRFLSEVDAAAVYVNASTRFTDGSQFGLGAELGISTQKMHARGPMGLKEITSYKWIIFGNGQVRP
jgi:glutamate-5-semialdehyde dehydrogenase